MKYILVLFAIFAMLAIAFMSARKAKADSDTQNQSPGTANHKKVTLTGKIILVLGFVIFASFIGIVILTGLSFFALILLCLFTIALSVGSSYMGGGKKSGK